MHYILTQEEYDDLQDKVSESREALERDLFTLCQMVADHKPIPIPWEPESPPRPWGCIHTKQRDAINAGYCDECPVQARCPSKRKRWSK